ncbi:MAG: transporter substrate-binding domain-containing protein [Tannerellaceae bacterium]|nr:transporter substrate-binding domain-containing protein [Tannerellaceae bacterium]
MQIVYLKKKILLFSLLTITLFGCFSCYGNKDSQTKEETSKQVDLPQLKVKGELTAVTLYSSTSYFQYKMQPMGYEYDLVRDFARSQGLKLTIKVAENITKLTEMLIAGEADIVAYPVPVTNNLRQEVSFCGREDLSTQVLVQRSNKGDTLIKDVTQLIGKSVYVRQGTKYHERLSNLDLELGGGIQINNIENDSTTAEDLIEMVSTGQIPYTVSDDKTARLNKTYYNNIDISLKVSFLQRSSWAVRKGSPLLAKAVNEWATDKTSDFNFKAITKRYFELSKIPEQVAISKIIKGHISPYDHFFKKYAERIDLDWRLLASISYQESHFDPLSISWAGAEGLMGIMPNTARGLGVSSHELKNPEIGIKTGTECFRRFRQGFSEISNEEEKLKFTLAAYNAGIGHVYDAQRLARKYGKDPTKWDGNVDEFIRKKSDPIYYNDSICKHGYLRGSETFKYVSDVLARFNYYKKNTKI